MKPAGTLAILAFAALVAACDGEPVGPASGPAAPSKEFGLTESATVQHSVLRVPASTQLGALAKALIEACVGEPLEIVGDGLLVSHVTTLADGSQHVVLHRNPMGVVLIGQITGTHYRLGAADVVVEFISPSGGYTATFNARLNVSAKGTGFSFPILLHVTITPTGEVTAEIEIVGPLACR